MRTDLPESWQAVVGDELGKPYFAELARFVDGERARQTVFPPEEDVFNALRYTPFDQVTVLLLGQDPYHDEGQAHGLCFSVRPGVKPPPSLANIFTELERDLGCRRPDNGYLVPWAEQGVLLLNAVLTVRAHTANSHKGRGWERFTDQVIRAVSARAAPAVFVLWGAYAQKKIELIDTARHAVVQAAHPSPLSARFGFFGSRPFSRINAQLRATGQREIDWKLPNVA
jgi:uracil-DNA glycosylase